jgi:regulator of sigma E protease
MELLTTAFNILLIILGFGVLIFVHELGHFITAKWAGIRAEVFAVGMGPVAIAWRKGIGFRFGSTARDYEKRVRQFLDKQSPHRLITNPAVEQSSELPQAEMYRIGDQLGLGETEYSLRWLPIGGFVKMLGQEDANPNYVSNDPRSYTRCPVGKRMIVVSAGVIMNILLAIVLFIIAFMYGVKLQAPVIGDVSPMLAAGRTLPENADRAGVTLPGLQPGDVVLAIDGKPAKTFADLQIASAMSKPGVPVHLRIKRHGVAEPLEFDLLPEKDPYSGLLSIGVGPGKSTTLWDKDEQNILSEVLTETGLSVAGVKPGMQMVRANGREVQTYEQFQQIVERSEGIAVMTEWAWPRGSRRMTDEEAAALVRSAEPRPSLTRQAPLEVQPAYEIMRYARPMPSTVPNFESGLLGLVALPQVRKVLSEVNAQVLKPGDVILRVGDIDGPRAADLHLEVAKHKAGEIELVVLRDGQRVSVTAKVDRKGKMNVMHSPAWGVPLVARTMDEIAAPFPAASAGAVSDAGNTSANRAGLIAQATAAADLRLLPLTHITAIGGQPVQNWADIRRELQDQTADALAAGSGAVIAITTILPTPGHDEESLELHLKASDVAALHQLTWQTALSSIVFDPLQTTLTAGGNPFKAIAMGFDETRKLVMMTYLTIDRLIRGSVGVEQLRGPVGIVHMGTKIADQGMLYMLFFLGMISVNLAVINFLPMPIVDGGLFLFLIYEKFKGRPPSLAFQNAATIIGLCIIGALFVVTFYNDVLRLIG